MFATHQILYQLVRFLTPSQDQIMVVSLNCQLYNSLLFLTTACVVVFSYSLRVSYVHFILV
jgi:hypothetical protein